MHVVMLQGNQRQQWMFVEVLDASNVLCDVNVPF